MFVDTPVQSVINNNRQYNFGMCNSKANAGSRQHIVNELSYSHLQTHV